MQVASALKTSAKQTIRRNATPDVAFCFCDKVQLRTILLNDSVLLRQFLYQVCANANPSPLSFQAPVALDLAQNLCCDANYTAFIKI